jgi:hypothetical protein
MGGDVLSQAEVESLLSAMATSGEPGTTAAVSAPVTPAKPTMGGGGLAAHPAREKVTPSRRNLEARVSSSGMVRMSRSSARSTT